MKKRFPILIALAPVLCVFLIAVLLALNNNQLQAQNATMEGIEENMKSPRNASGFLWKPAEHKLLPTHISREIEYLQTQEQASAGDLSLYRDIIDAQCRIKDRIDGKDIYPEISEQNAKSMLERGSPLLDFNQIRIDTEILESLFDEICVILKKHNKIDKVEIKGLMRARKEGRLSLMHLIEKLASHDVEYINSVADNLDVNRDALLFAAVSSARPFFEICAEKFQKHESLESLWLRNYCPVCGGEPTAMAKLHRPDGAMILQCTLCNTEWRFMRIKCPSCGNDDHNSLGYFPLDENIVHRLYVCDKCKRFTKVVDERKLGECRSPSLEAYDIATLYLDAQAEGEGWKNSQLNHKGIFRLGASKDAKDSTHTHL